MPKSQQRQSSSSDSDSTPKHLRVQRTGTKSRHHDALSPRARREIAIFLIDHPQFISEEISQAARDALASRAGVTVKSVMDCLYTFTSRRDKGRDIGKRWLSELLLNICAEKGLPTSYIAEKVTRPRGGVARPSALKAKAKPRKALRARKSADSEDETATESTDEDDGDASFVPAPAPAAAAAAQPFMERFANVASRVPTPAPIPTPAFVFPPAPVIALPAPVPVPAPAPAPAPAPVRGFITLQFPMKPAEIALPAPAPVPVPPAARVQEMQSLPDAFTGLEPEMFIPEESTSIFGFSMDACPSDDLSPADEFHTGYTPVACAPPMFVEHPADLAYADFAYPGMSPMPDPPPLFGELELPLM